MSFIVAIDGPAGSGKGTITKLIAEELGLVNIDTGATFRCVALNMIQQGVKLEEEEKIKKILEKINIEMKQDGTVYLNGEEVTKKIRQKDVDNTVSQVSALKIVRSKLLDLQRNIAKGKDVIVEGRDIGTVVFPNADVKVYLDATPEKRAIRRMKQNEEKGIKTTYEEVLNNIITRDKIDLNKSIAPLKKADDATYIDSSDLTIEEVKNKIIELINKKR